MENMENLDRPAFDTWEQIGRTYLRSVRKDSPHNESADYGEFTVLTPISTADIVACLVGDDALRKFVLPIVGGRNLVGKSEEANYVKERDLLSGVEGAQWRIRWAPERVTVEDIGSTNGAVLIRKQDRETKPLNLRGLTRCEGVDYIGWDGKKVHSDAYELHDGDVLVNIYGVFLYCDSIVR